MAHWGVEYEHTPTTQQQREAHAFIDAGADLVVGAHPHVVQSTEVYKDKAIFYSLGNFMFDQNFSWAVQHGLAIAVDFYKAKTEVTLTPVSIVEQHVVPAEGTDRAEVLRLAGLPSGEGAIVDTLLLP
jgi:poly-gamma-glutamate synthesis protein (capsule biosynthesis protein)